MLKDAYPLYLAGKAIEINHDLEVRNKYTGDVAARVTVANRAVVADAITKAHAACHACATWPAHKRRAALDHIREAIEARSEELAHCLAVEAGKPIQLARGEVARAIDTFRLSAEEATRIGGEYMPLDISERGEGYEAIWKRVPVGPCSFITPFNFPLNLAAHKVGPAIAAGCPFVLKPDPRTPISALILGEIMAEAGLPAAMFSILPVVKDGLELFSEDERWRLLSFTGSDRVGWDLKMKARKAKVILELGGNAACIVDEGAALDRAAERIVFGGYYQSGQSCISVQRIFAHRSVYEDLKSRLVERIGSLKSGDPLDEDVFLGPMIDEEQAKRVETWVTGAVEAGAKVLIGGKRSGTFYEPTLLEDVDAGQKVSSEEVFGPVTLIEPFTSFEDAIRLTNESRFGLQAGVFTPNIHHAFRAWDEIVAGGVIINDIPSTRIDSMPYGGVKDSGLGREGVRFAIEDMTEIRVMVIKRR